MSIQRWPSNNDPWAKVALAMPPSSLPAPCSAELQPNYYVVRDADGQQIAYIYYLNDDRRSAAKLLTKNEARVLG